MIIGLFDGDYNPNYPFCYNLDLMKLAAYYKNKGEIVKLSPLFNPDQYTKFIVRKEYDYLPFPDDLMKHKNVEFGGSAFGTKITSMPFEIEVFKPDYSIYNSFVNRTQISNFFAVYHESMSKAEHFRISLDGKSVWGDYECQTNKKKSSVGVYLHDYNLNNVEGAAEAIEDFISKYSSKAIPRTLGVKHPIIVHSFEELKRWIWFKPNQQTFKIIYDKFFTDQEIYELVNIGMHYPKETLNSIQIDISKASLNEYDFFVNHLPRIFKQLLFLRSHQGFFSLIYEENFFVNEDAELAIKLINQYCNYLKRELSKYHEENIMLKYTNFIMMCRKLTEKNPYTTNMITKPMARKAVAFMGNYNFQFGCDLYKINKILYDENGGFYFDSKRNPARGR